MAKTLIMELEGKAPRDMVADDTCADAGFDERALIEQCLGGDIDAFEPLVRCYRGELIGIACLILGDSDSAEEAAQEAFYRAYKSLDSFESGRKFGLWLRRILVNYCLDIKRRNKRESAMLAFKAEELHRGADSGKRERTLLRAALRELPARQRAAVVLRDIKDYPSAEAAEILGIGESTVRVHLFHGRRKLRKIYCKLEKAYKEWKL